MIACWLALAAAVSLCGGGAGDLARIARLTGAARLSGGTGLFGTPGEATARHTRPRWARARPLIRRVGARAALTAGVMAGVTACLALWLATGAPLAIAAAAVGAAAWAGVRSLRARRARTSARADLSAALHVLAAELSAGARPGEALDAAARASPSHESAFVAAAAKAAAGQDAGAVLRAHMDLAALGVAWQLGEQAGVALAAVVERVRGDLTADAERHRAASVALAGPRSSAAVLAGLPLLGLVLGAAMGARPVPFLVGTSAGRLACCVGVLLDLAGTLWMGRLLSRAERG